VLQFLCATRELIGVTWRDRAVPAAFGPAVQKTGPLTDAAGGHFVVRTEKIAPLNGTPPKRFVILSFASVDAAKAWADNPTMKEMQSEIDKYSKQVRFIVEGI
jgi:uncharacterized protein (DUF1330 family)